MLEHRLELTVWDSGSPTQDQKKQEEEKVGEKLFQGMTTSGNVLARL